MYIMIRLFICWHCLCMPTLNWLILFFIHGNHRPCVWQLHECIVLDFFSLLFSTLHMLLFKTGWFILVNRLVQETPGEYSSTPPTPPPAPPSSCSWCSAITIYRANKHGKYTSQNWLLNITMKILFSKSKWYAVLILKIIVCSGSYLQLSHRKLVKKVKELRTT